MSGIKSRSTLKRSNQCTILEYNVKRQEEVVLKADVLMVCFDTKSRRLGKIEGGMMEHINGINQGR